MTDTRAITIRARIAELLDTGVFSAQELSRAIGVKEKEVCEHLSHVARSVQAHHKRLLIEPSECISCGFVFKKRSRFTAPSKCPVCRSEEITRPRFFVKLDSDGRG